MVRGVLEVEPGQFLDGGQQDSFDGAVGVDARAGESGQVAGSDPAGVGAAESVHVVRGGGSVDAADTGECDGPLPFQQWIRRATAR